MPRGRSAAGESPARASTSATAAACAGVPSCEPHAIATWRALELVALDHAVAHRRQRLQRLRGAAQHAGELGVAGGRQDGAAGVHHDGVDAVTRLDHAPAHLLDDADLQRPRTITACPSCPSSRRSSRPSIPWSRARRYSDVPVAHFAVVKTATPPLDWLAGHSFTGARATRQAPRCSRPTTI